ncbi:hypothetical protein MPC1_7250003 [Methylocella tundrae]|uniref:hypothetical protein n=1 Tax=Methylocella tundrae TaxID=227605 RepID=UPI001313879B|nr:hypothetical protein [Methylocella tundrae]VTZ27987.1 hypothetical protein MPC1_7250003 [Methylocella tundrae]
MAKGGLFAGLIMAALSLEPALARDLIQPPPEIDGAFAPSRPKPVIKKPHLAKRIASKDKAATPAAAIAGPSRPADPAEPSLSKKDSSGRDDPFSVDMNWKANNEPIYGGVSTSGVIERYNETVNGQSLGSGAEVGVKYKF